MTRFLIPLTVFIILVLFLGFGLTHDPRRVPSPLIDKPAPAFALPQLLTPEKTLSPGNMLGSVWLLNVWASWCVSCRAEHAVLNQWTRNSAVKLVGLNYKDHREDALAWLRQLGNPYSISVVDAAGQTGIDWGVYGVPETFVIDSKGIVRYKHIGPLTQEDIDTIMTPLLKKLQSEKPLQPS